MTTGAELPDILAVAATFLDIHAAVTDNHGATIAATSPGALPARASRPDGRGWQDDRFGVRRYFQNATLSPDFPRAAAVMEQLYTQATGAPVDGVVGIDPIALARILELTGPVRVADWPEPIGPSNAVAVLLHDQYLHLDRPEREGFLAQVTRAVFDALVHTGVRDWGQALRTVAPAVRGRHLMVHAVRPAEQSALAALRLAGAMAPVRGDYLQVITQNGGENKIDWFLRRKFRYSADFDTRTG
ncbi:MAG: hypothetical protein C4321_09620, partial [Chloroflexota bacterium]